MNRELLAKAIERARADAAFFHALVFDPDRAFAELGAKPPREVSPAEIFGKLLRWSAGCDESTTCCCTSGTCGGSTCGGSTCDVTCSGDSCGNTCGDSCGTTSNLESWKQLVR